MAQLVPPQSVGERPQSVNRRAQRSACISFTDLLVNIHVFDIMLFFNGVRLKINPTSDLKIITISDIEVGVFEDGVEILS